MKSAFAKSSAEMNVLHLAFSSREPRQGGGRAWNRVSLGSPHWATGCQSKEMSWKNSSFFTLHQSRLKTEVSLSQEAALAHTRLQMWAVIALWW